MGCCAAANSQQKQQNKDGAAADPQVLEINGKANGKVVAKSPAKSAEKTGEKVAEDSDDFDASLELTETEAHSKPMQINSKPKSNTLRGDSRSSTMLMVEIADKLNYVGGPFPQSIQPTELKIDDAEISSMPGQLQYDMIGQLMVFKTFSEKYLCHQPAINAKNFSNYLYYVPTSMFSEDPNDPSKWIIGLDQSYPINLDFAIGNIWEYTEDIDTIVCPMFEKQLNSDIIEQLPAPQNLHQQFDSLYLHLDESSQKYRTGAVTALEVPSYENKAQGEIPQHLIFLNLPEPSQADYLQNLKIALINLFDVAISLGKQKIQISLDGAIGNEDSLRVIIYYLVYICHIPSSRLNKLQSITLICNDEEERLQFYNTISQLNEAWTE